MTHRQAAESIWRAAVDAVRPQTLVAQYLATGNLPSLLASARRIIVVGAGKAGAAMAEGVEQALGPHLGRVTGWVNVPAGTVRLLKVIHLHAARPDAHNHPTTAGIAGATEILRLVGEAGPEDVVLCLLSGGGSALLPAPAADISLEDKQRVTLQLHASSANIQEMNAVRKHLSRIKGGGLAQAFHGNKLISLIISDVAGDPLDVIASGPTAPDPTTYQDALAVLQRHHLMESAPAAVVDHIKRGADGELPETLKLARTNVEHLIIGSAATALEAARAQALRVGYQVCDLGIDLPQDNDALVEYFAGLAEQKWAGRWCYLAGGETTVKLPPDHGLGGRNQHFVLALAVRLNIAALPDFLVFSGGTDGEDGPTDAAGAFADQASMQRAAAAGLEPRKFLDRHDAYHFFEAIGDLFKPGLTQTNVMDIRLVLSGTERPE
jgi:hydroxypyruvate reductase/glycerate 2-kinase